MKPSILQIVFLLFLILQSPHSMGNNQSDTTMCVRLFDYQSEDKLETSWRLINDNVMGGKSIGQLAINKNHLSFSGFINTDGGGFSSIRHSVPSLPFIGVDHIRISIRSDGRPYTLSLADEFSVRRGISHRVKIDAEDSVDFQEVTLQANDLTPMFRGRRVQAPSLNTNAIQELRIMLSDSIDGDFRLDLQWIDVCRL